MDAARPRSDLAAVAARRTGGDRRVGHRRRRPGTHEADIAHTADSILAGAFTGDFAVALERASAFVDVVAQGLRVEARHMVRQAEAKAGSETATAADLAEAHVMRSRSAKLMHTAGNLIATSKDFRHGAQLWRRGKLD